MALVAAHPIGRVAPEKRILIGQRLHIIDVVGQVQVSTPADAPIHVYGRDRSVRVLCSIF